MKKVYQQMKAVVEDLRFSTDEALAFAGYAERIGLKNSGLSFITTPNRTLVGESSRQVNLAGEEARLFDDSRLSTVNVSAV